MVDSPILQTCWVCFLVDDKNRTQKEFIKEDREGTKWEKSMCRRNSNCLTLFMESGATYYVPLPFLVRQMTPLPVGLLIERDTTGEESGSVGLPIFFSLLHPMSDLCPVSIKRPSVTTTSVTVLGYVTDTQLHVVGSCCHRDQSCLLLLYHTISGAHSIWHVRTASTEDIPAHVHTPHHQRRAHSSTITPQPHSTSAPSLIPTAQEVETPVQMVLTGKRKIAACHLQKASPYLLSGGGRGSSGSLKLGSGRSPYIARLQSPLTVTTQKRSKSVSPPLLSRISPFSQTVHTNSWGTFFSAEESAASLDPLLPQLCLHRLLEMDSPQERALAFFGSDCLLSTEYHLYYLIPSLLWVLPYQSVVNGKQCGLVCVPATHAMALPSLSVVLVLSPTGELSVYSGALKVCTLDIEWLWGNSEVEGGVSGGDDVKTGERMEEGDEKRVVGIRDGVETHFIVELSSGEVLHCTLPQLYSHRAVEQCVKAIADILPNETAHKMLADYYSSCICHSSSISPSLHHFRHWLFSILHLPQYQEGVKLGKLALIPALKLFNTPLSSADATYTSPQPLSREPAFLVKYRQHIFMALHLVYEELKLHTFEASSLPELAYLLHKLAMALGLTGYCDHYQTDHPALLSRTTSERMSEQERGEGEGEGEGESDAVPQSPPHIFHWLQSSLRGEEVPPFPFLSVCSRTVMVVKLYGLYTASGGGITSLLSQVPDTAITQWEQLQTKSSSPYERVVLGMMEDGLTRKDLDSLPVSVALPLWDAIFRCREKTPPSWDLAAYEIIGRDDIVKTIEADVSTSVMIESPEKDDGMTLDQEILRLHFPKDLRVNEVRRMLNSSQPVKIALEQKPEVSDHEFIEQQEISLLMFCQRTLSLPVGRGMFTLATARPLPTSPLSIPTLELTGRAPPRNSTVGLEHIEKPPNMTVWAEFHNGVAAGLRIAPGISKLDSTWIISNRSSLPPSSIPQGEDNPQRNSTHHAGVLLALGLTGHLTSLMDYELYEYLHEYLHDKHELTTIAVLLGISAARVGSMQRSVASILSIFLPPLLPFGAADMEVSQSIQTAGLVSMGLLYMASGNRHLTEVMLREIGHIPGPELEFAEDRESYALAAGLALGMITLGRGGDLPGTRLVERLSVFISGGPKQELLSGMVPQTPSHLVLEMGIFSYYELHKQEPAVVNTHVTSPAATVALGLMYLKTNDSSVASRLNTPNSLYELDYIRSDFFILRSVSRGLIMWDDVKPTQEWIDGNIPEIVQRYAFQSSSKSGANQDHSIDYQTLSEAMVCISAGCCMAMGLRYAGTCDTLAHGVLMKNIKFLLSKMGSSSCADEVGKACLEMCLNVILLSAAMVMSGSGDLDILRVVRRLHARVSQPEVTYGCHMASHMALGLLFLGGCRYSLSRSNQAIASLYISLFPLFPSSPTDSRYHLQALRHLYVLAVEPRVLVTQDVETGQARSVEVRVREQQEFSGRTPCILPEWTSIEEIEICSPDYWPMTLNLSGEDNKMRQVLVRSGTIFVRRKTGGFTQEQGSLLHPLSPHIYNTCHVKGKLDLSEGTKGRNPLLKSSYNHLLSSDNKDSMWQRFLAATLLECVAEEKLPVFPSILHLDKISRNVLSPTLPSSMVQLWQLKLAWALASRVQNDSFQLLHIDLAQVMHLRVKRSLYQYSDTAGEERVEEVLRSYFIREEGEVGEREAEWLAATMAVYDVPPRHRLNITEQTTVPQLLAKVQSLHAPPSTIVCLLPLMKSKLPQPLNLPFL